jgi:excinuclease UvrABC ATPase subunit
VGSGTPEEIAANPRSHTGEYLRPLLGTGAGRRSGSGTG